MVAVNLREVTEQGGPMAFNVKDLAFKLEVTDGQEAHIEVAHLTDPVAQGDAVTCGPSNPPTGGFALKWEMNFNDNDHFNRLKEQLHKFLDEFDAIELEP
jgi:uncharacterized protein YciI